jgi:hypothetical protein
MAALQENVKIFKLHSGERVRLELKNQNNHLFWVPLFYAFAS